MDVLIFNSVENVPGIEARATFIVNSATVLIPIARSCFAFKEEVDIMPTIFDVIFSYVPWGGNNLLPYNIIDLIEKGFVTKAFSHRM